MVDVGPSPGRLLPVFALITLPTAVLLGAILLEMLRSGLQVGGVVLATMAIAGGALPLVYAMRTRVCASEEDVLVRRWYGKVVRVSRSQIDSLRITRRSYAQLLDSKGSPLVMFSCQYWQLKDLREWCALAGIPVDER